MKSLKVTSKPAKRIREEMARLNISLPERAVDAPAFNKQELLVILYSELVKRMSALEPLLQEKEVAALAEYREYAAGNFGNDDGESESA